MHAGDLNSGHHAFVASAESSEPSSLPPISIFWSHTRISLVIKINRAREMTGQVKSLLYKLKDLTHPYTQLKSLGWW